MADKAATVYIVDLGKDMGKKHSGRDESDLDFALRYVWDKITSTVANGRKTDTVGVLGLRTDDTDNEQASDDDDSYNHIAILKPIGQCLMQDIRNLREQFIPSKTNKGDGISAIVVAMEMIKEYTKKLKYIRSIIMVTNGTGSFDPDGLDVIVETLKEMNINLTILGVDFDDESYGFKEEDKPPHKANNERMLAEFCDQANGTFGTVEEAVMELQNPRGKTVRPVATYRGTLTLGNKEKQDVDVLSIDVERYPKIMVQKPVSATSFTANAEEEAMEQIRQNRVYRVDDETIAGAKLEVDRDELDRGYTYGKEVVPISETDKSITDFETEPGLEILGFIPQDTYHPFMGMSNAAQIVAQKGNMKASIALSSLIHALYELKNLAIARLVTKAMRPPVLVVLAPHIEPDYECLLEVQLPFAEDVRKYRFPPIGVVKTLSGKELEKHRNLPSDELEQAMSDYVEAMDLMTAAKDEDGDVCEYAAVEDTFSPVYHRVSQAIKWRAIHPDGPVPPPHAALTKYAHPPEDLIKKVKPTLDALVKAADLKPVPPKARGRRGREAPKPLSGLDVDKLLESDAGKKLDDTHIDPANAIPEFRQKLDHAKKPETIHNLSKVFMSMIKEIIEASLADSNYDRAAEMLGVLKDELREFEEAGLYNQMMKELKKELLAGELGGDRKEMWTLIKTEGLGLILKAERDDPSGVDIEEAKAFLKA